MNCVLMKQYIEFVADRLLVALQQPKVTIHVFHYTNTPFDVISPIVSHRCSMSRIRLTLWRTFHWRGRQTSLRREWESIKRLVSCQTKRNMCLHWMQISNSTHSLSQDTSFDLFISSVLSIPTCSVALLKLLLVLSSFGLFILLCTCTCNYYHCALFRVFSMVSKRIKSLCVD